MELFNLIYIEDLNNQAVGPVGPVTPAIPVAPVGPVGPLFKSSNKNSQTLSR